MVEKNPSKQLSNIDPTTISFDTEPEPSGEQSTPGCGAEVAVDATTFPDPSETPNAHLRGTIENFDHLLKLYGITVRFNVMKKRPEVDIPGVELNGENRSEAVLAYLTSLAIKHRMSKSEIPSYLLTLAGRNRYHPVADWIDSKPWDGKDRLSAICSTIAPDASFPLEFAALLIRKWLLSIVAAVFLKQGFKTRGTLTLQGAQGIGKSSWFRSLISDPILQADAIKLGHSWDGGSKDAKLGAIRHLIVELGEIEGSFRREMAGLKAFLTEEFDKIRPPYGRTEAEFERRTAFGASVNDAQFLVDTTGNSRFWVIPVERLDYDHTVDMQQVFAQLKVELDDGCQWWLTHEEDRQLDELNRRHRTPSAIRELIEGSLDLSRSGLSNLPKLTAMEVLKALDIKNPSNGQAKDANATLRELLGEPKRINGNNRWSIPWVEPSSLGGGWKPPAIADEDEF